MYPDIRKLEAERDELLRSWKNPVPEEPWLSRQLGSDLRNDRLDLNAPRIARPRDEQLWIRFRDWLGRRQERQ